MNFLIDNAEKIADALPKGTQKKLAEKFAISENAIGQYLRGRFALTSNEANRTKKRVEILEGAIAELEPAATLVQQYKQSRIE